MFLLIFAFIGLLLDLCLSVVWGAIRLALYLSPFFLFIFLLRSLSRY